jgi:flagellar hook-associated protein 3 FlgL
MRVTDKMIFDRATTQTGRAQTRVQDMVNENASGLKLEHPWDDPAGVAPVVAHRLAVKRFKAIETVAGRTSDELVAADNALSGVADVLTRARVLAVQLSNPTYSAEDRLSASEEVRQLAQHTIGLLNTQVGNRYIFGGNLDDVPPFQGDGSYVGDTGVRRVEVFPGVLQDASIRADVMAKGVGGGVDILQTLADLSAALSTNDVDAVRSSLDTLDGSITQVSVGRAQTGAVMNTLDVAATSSRLAANDEQTSLARITEADVFESASNLALAQRALEAALTASVRSFDLSLLKKFG